MSNIKHKHYSLYKAYRDINELQLIIKTDTDGHLRDVYQTFQAVEKNTAQNFIYPDVNIDIGDGEMFVMGDMIAFFFMESRVTIQIPHDINAGKAHYQRSSLSKHNKQCGKPHL